MTTIQIPFSKFEATGNAANYLNQVLLSGRTQGDGPFSKTCEALLKTTTGCESLVLTSSGTDALEMATIMAGISPGDEVIMPSFTFVSSANAVVLRGGVPVFVDIKSETLNIDPRAIEGALSPRTKAIMPVHYAGVACDMEEILGIARSRGLKIIEDAAHGVGATWRGRHLGTIGDFGALSFHETKNIVAGEGGAILVNDRSCRERMEIVRDKGTNRKKFLRGEVDRYTWVDVGSSFLPSELQAALLASQLEQIDQINGQRRNIWQCYHDGLADLELSGRIRRPQIHADCQHNGHIFWILLEDGTKREALRKYLAEHGVQTTSHYECLHKAPVAAKYAKVSSAGLPVTEAVVKNILRLPLFPQLRMEQVDLVIDLVRTFFQK